LRRGLKPISKGAIEKTMEVGECIQKPAPDGPGGFMRAFLVDFLDIRFALTPQVLSMADARSKSIASSVTHIRGSKDLEV
jgi:hypothetical protein